MFLDASALVAILANEPERGAFLRKLQSSDRRTTSVVAVFEAALALSRATGSCAAAHSEVQRFMDIAGIVIEETPASLLPELAIAWDRYGKTSESAARLNMGDCVSYAFAKLLGVPLLFKGNDFIHTDLVAA
ncbi:MAG: type II toxin-antitoxin system VapC family toxin [Rhizobiaceae bacterium]|nr:type II toxin-antitoxin system VapC family toxin [Rhizobiaceae bacterium]